MKPLYKGLILAAVHVVLVCSLGGKLLTDRAHYPRVWVRTAAYDPDLPLRGRYAAVRLEVKVPDAVAQKSAETTAYSHARLEVRNGELYAIPDSRGTVWFDRMRTRTGAFSIGEPVAFFLPEHVADPTRRAPGEELWAEVTVPRKGPPRPIRLGVKKGGTITPLAFD